MCQPLQPGDALEIELREADQKDPQKCDSAKTRDFQGKLMKQVCYFFPKIVALYY